MEEYTWDWILGLQDQGAVHNKRDALNMRMPSQDTGFYMLQDPLKWCGHTAHTATTAPRSMEKAMAHLKHGRNTWIVLEDRGK